MKIYIYISLLSVVSGAMVRYCPDQAELLCTFPKHLFIDLNHDSEFCSKFQNKAECLMNMKDYCPGVYKNYFYHKCIVRMDLLFSAVLLYKLI
ncbi:uncharacterized protein LOC128249866 isoform X2 [Octopus bimaculoides]|uniref:uncharacterized protein LOC128249866 isoform X2 n=1 Tax=Octopus bimaculoides TaxID=37653 RepID=UPI0022E046B0|nr:uncharacterized protein LOC128249866 isoform X2 [Octopus bimaculoides]